MVAGDAFMVRDRFIVDKRALREVRGGDYDAAGPFAVGSSGDVVTCRRGLERGNCLDRYRRLGKQRKQSRQFRLHLRYVPAKIIENLLGGSGFVFGIGFERCAESSEIREALF